MRMGWAAPEVSSDEVEGLIEVLSLLFQDPLPGGLYTLLLAPQIMHTYLLSYLLIGVRPTYEVTRHRLLLTDSM